MGYKIVAVNPLIKPFPLVSFGLTNVASLEGIKEQAFLKYKKIAQSMIDADEAYAKSSGCETLNNDGRAEIFNDFREGAEKALGKFEKTRWPKIGPALEAHLARQKRRLAHFEASCRFLGCDNPHRQKHGRGLERNTKAHRPMVKPLFCGVHVGLRKLLTEKQLAEIHAASEKRVVAK